MALILAGIITAGSSGCVLSSDRCGPNEMLYGQIQRCVCVANAANTGTGCVLCGANEVPGTNSCVCAPGYAKGADGTCAMLPAGLGTSCDASTPCTDATYNYCATSANGSGYCTVSACASDTDCPSGYACNAGATPAYCQRPPVGTNVSCTTDADCTAVPGSEATYCDTFVTHACLVQGCSLTPDNCFEGTECCDLSSFGIPMPLCIAAGACTT